MGVSLPVAALRLGIIRNQFSPVVGQVWHSRGCRSSFGGPGSLPDRAWFGFLPTETLSQWKLHAHVFLTSVWEWSILLICRIIKTYSGLSPWRLQCLLQAAAPLSSCSEWQRALASSEALNHNEVKKPWGPGLSAPLDPLQMFGSFKMAQFKNSIRLG